jgi:hypothetical protein
MVNGKNLICKTHLSDFRNTKKSVDRSKKFYLKVIELDNCNKSNVLMRILTTYEKRSFFLGQDEKK